MLKRKLLADQNREMMIEEFGDDAESILDESSSSEEEDVSTTDVGNLTQKVLILSSRGVNSRSRHFMKDISLLLPHGKKEAKFDSKSRPELINELLELNDCSSCLYFEARRHTDLYLWAAMSPNGPSARFLVQNIHTLDELKMQGNCLKGSRPVISFDSSFDASPHYSLVKECLRQIFNTPQRHRKSKPFVDHVISFSIADNRIWFRNYQIVDTMTDAKDVEISLNEIGPRCVLTLMKIFSGCFSGPILYDNPEFVSPHSIRMAEHRDSSQKYKKRVAQEPAKIVRKEQKSLPKNELEAIFE